MQFYSRSNLSILACVVAVWGAFPFAVLEQDATAAKPKQHVAVGLQKQLLVDDFVIAEKHNVARALGKVTKWSAPLKLIRVLYEGSHKEIFDDEKAKTTKA